jgi:hypothetical protein
MERDRKTERDREISTLFTRLHTVYSRHPAFSSTYLISVWLACHNIIHRFDNHELGIDYLNSASIYNQGQRV